MAGITASATELMIGGGIVRRAPLGTTKPLKTVAYAGAWPAGWDDVGLTSAPTVVGYGFTVAEADQIQQALAVVRRAKASESAHLETRLAQAANLKAQEFAGAGGTFAAFVGTPTVNAYESWQVGGIDYMTPYMWGFEGKWNDDATGLTWPVRAFFIGNALEGADLEFDKTKFADGLALKVGALEDLSLARGLRLMDWYRVTGPTVP